MTYFWILVTFDDGHIAKLPLTAKSFEQVGGEIATYKRMAHVKSVELVFK